MRYLLTLLLAGALAACTGTATSDPTSDASLDLFSAAPSAAMSEDMDASHDMSSDDATAMDCEGAFDDLAAEDVDSITDLASLTDDLDDTIEACESVDEWTSQAEQAMPDVDLTDVEMFLAARCEESTLVDSSLCEELAS